MSFAPLNDLQRLGSVLVLALATLLATDTAQAQLPQTRLQSVFPPGGQIGSTVELTVAGADIDEVNAMSFSHPGITAVQKTTEANGKKTPVANTFVVKIDGKVPAGFYDVRISGLFGTSNPRTFAVSSRKHLRESEANNAFTEADEMELGSTLAGQIGAAADVDYLKFTGKQGQRVIIDCQAVRIDTQLNAVVEVYRHTGNRVQRLAFGRRQIGHDPLADVTLPADGEYIVRIFDERYSGGGTYGYLLTAHTGPHIDYVQPAAGEPGKTGTFTLFGRNLTGGQPSGVRIDGRELQRLVVKIAVPKTGLDRTIGGRVEAVSAGLDAFEYSLKTDSGVSNPVPIYFTSGATAVEAEPNNTAEKAQKIQVPGEVTGQFQSRGDEDVFEFAAKAGDAYWLEVFSQRIGAPADPYLIVDQVQVDKEGKETAPKRLTAQDDNGANLFGNHFDTLTDDPVYKFTAPAEGKYRITVRDRNFEARGSARMVYRLAIRKETRDFRVVVVPTSQNTGANSNTAVSFGVGLRKGDHFVVRALAFRRDGFNGEIEITAEGLPKGVICKGTTIGAGQTSAPLVFSASEDAPELTAVVKLVAKARVEDLAKVKIVTDAGNALTAAVAAVPKAAAAIVAATGPAKKALDARTVAEKKYNAENTVSTAAAKLKATADKKVVDTKKAAAAAGTAAAAAKKKSTAAAKALADAQAAAKKAADDAAKKKAAAAVKAATTAKAAADKAAADTAKTATTTKKAADDAAKAKTAADKKATDTANLTKASKSVLDKADAASKAAQAKLVAAQKAKTDADKKVVQTTAALAAAKTARDAAARQVTHIARTGTIVIDGNQNQTAVSRLSQSLVVSVMKEKAPFQAQTNIFRVDANRNRQILVPVKLAKRDGFDNKVTLTFVGQPKNIQVQNKPINKGKNSEVLRIFLPANAPLGTYALYLRSQGEVAYRRNVFRVERVKAEQTKVTATLKPAADALKAATAVKVKADKLAADTAKAAEAAKKAAAAAAKKLTDAQAAAKKAADDAAKKKAAAAVTAATEAKAKADKLAADTKKAADTAAAAKVKSDATAKQATDKDKAAKAAKAAADKAVTAANNAAKAKKVNSFPASTPIVISIRNNPATLKADVPGKGALKRGAKIDVKVTVTRANGFTGPVTLSLPLPPGVADVSAKAVTIPADKTAGVLAISAGPKATEGALANMVVRATMQYDGREALVDQPVTIKVAK